MFNSIKKYLLTFSLVLVLIICFCFTNVFANNENSNNANHEKKGPIKLFLERASLPLKLPVKGYVALTFDDGPYPPTTNRVLDKLKEYNAKATFYVLGNRAEKYRDTVKRIYDEGNEIGNHSYSHKNLTKVDEVQFNIEVNGTNNIIENIIGKKPETIRPPYGANNEEVNKKIGMPLVNWNIDTLDWKHKNPELIKQNILNNLQDGNIILMHDIHSTTVDAIVDIIDDIHNMGYRMVTVSELAKIKGIPLDINEVYHKIK